MSLNFSLAMFLVARGHGSAKSPTGMDDHFEYNHDSWSKWPRWSDAETSWDEVKAMFAMPYGQPIGETVETSEGVFTREYEGATVGVDCHARTTSFVWKKGKRSAKQGAAGST